MFLSATRHRRNQTKIPALSRWLSLGREQKAFSTLLFFAGIAEFPLYSTIVLDPPLILCCSARMGQKVEQRSQGSWVGVEKSVLYLPVFSTRSMYYTIVFFIVSDKLPSFLGMCTYRETRQNLSSWQTRKTFSHRNHHYHEVIDFKMHFSGSIPLKSLKSSLHSIMVLVQTDNQESQNFFCFSVCRITIYNFDFFIFFNTYIICCS